MKEFKVMMNGSLFGMSPVITELETFSDKGEAEELIKDLKILNSDLSPDDKRSYYIEEA